MTTRVQRGRLAVDSMLDEFINTEALPGTGIDQAVFWQRFEAFLANNMEKNKALLLKRDELQAKIDAYHKAGGSLEINTYKQFLSSIGYLVEQPTECKITTHNVDPEIASMAGPQLVVPINNARYALNAANARWGSLYDALYGTDFIPQEGELAPGKGYNKQRGDAVIEKAKAYLDAIIPLENASHADVCQYKVASTKLIAVTSSHQETVLCSPNLFVGYTGNPEKPETLLFKHHGLHIEIQIDVTHAIGKTDTAGVKDVVVEAAITTIMDCEDSVAAVDAEDKTLVYQNWLGLMLGTLEAKIAKGDRTLVRTMDNDRVYTSPKGEAFSLPGRSLMFVRNVGHLMLSDAILLDGSPIYEGLMDGVITSLIAKHDLLKRGKFVNSKTGSVYIVKPKMHGPEEVAFTNACFGEIESMLDLEPNTLKIGIMDEERRTSVNLKACIAAASERVVFINTGFLDRTGDEIHTSMLAGAFAPKAELKARPWIHAYEKANVVTGLACELSGKAQIGKGMWPIPDQMANMMQAKVAHPKSGASTAWVPSPTAATLHALHYHDVDVFAVQKTLAEIDFDGIDAILDIPLLNDKPLDDDAIQNDLDNNVQGILGYVVRWVHQGVGCSKVPDINHVGLMEDRATLRISSQHIANWLVHGLVSEQQVDESLSRLAVLVDEQNKTDKEYIPMTPNPESSLGYQAARALIFEGTAQPNGYTEPLLHAMRQKMKATQTQQ
ncbi:malate synthase G [Alteromonas sediminis]|uniref:Malate synthase G n=1 Tax=Alteromonas sediminis TaxID=2259342 RepID=A0A3N5Y008_9ALTE|nr:malate synthase G [Alteromonas sediminis]RPJ65706.1 malate synthase G [Alteromonas sediminis]